MNGFVVCGCGGAQVLAQCEAKLMRLMDTVEGEQASIDTDLVPSPPSASPHTSRPIFYQISQASLHIGNMLLRAFLCSLGFS